VLWVIFTFSGLLGLHRSFGAEATDGAIDGLLVAPSDLDGLTDALATLMDDPALRDRISKSGRQRILEYYDLRRNVEQLAVIFSERLKH